MSTEPELDRLGELDLNGLRRVWAERYGAPPRLRSPELVRLMLAWRVQAEIDGGLDKETRRKIRRPVTDRVRSIARSGVRLTREWRGVHHEVSILEDGRVLFDGQTYASLSEVARKITGSRWNGPRFFGLRNGEVER